MAKTKVFDMGKNKINFVNCIKPTCPSRWNINVSRSCPLCDTKYVGKRKRNEMVVKSMIQKGKNFNHISDNETWEVKIDCVDDCSRSPKELIVWFKPLVKSKIDMLMDELGSIEWLAYLIGDAILEGENPSIIVDDLFIPDQIVTSTSVDNIICPEYNNIKVIGVIHSHHGMGTGFSGTDHEWINQNHNISIVVAKSGINGQIRWKTQCGSIKIIDAIIKIKMDVDWNEKEFLGIIKEKVKKRTFVSQNVNYYGYGGGGGYNKMNLDKLNESQRKYCTGAAITNENMSNLEKDEWDTDELNFDERTLAEELSSLDNSEELVKEMEHDDNQIGEIGMRMSNCDLLV